MKKCSAVCCIDSGTKSIITFVLRKADGSISDFSKDIRKPKYENVQELIPYLVHFAKFNGYDIRIISKDFNATWYDIIFIECNNNHRPVHYGEAG